MNTQQENKNTIRTARGKFIAMASAYCLGVFNDNYFKQAAMLLAVSAGLSNLQGTATILFSLPFIIFASYAGWVADRFAKKRVVIAAKGLECVAMLIGAAGLIFGSWPCILAMLFLMGLQSTFFNPALNGSIPELYPEAYVAKANGVLKLITTLAILAGIATAGITLDSALPTKFGLSSGTSMVAIMIVLISILGFAASFGVYSRPAADATKPFPKYGPISSVKDVFVFCKDPQLLLAFFSDAYFYFIASLAVLAINTFGLQQLGLSQTVTSLLTISLMLGICVGSLLVAQIIDMKNWTRFTIPSSLVMGCGLFLASVTHFLPESLQTIWLVGSLVIAGIAGGIFLIPVTSFLQIHPKCTEKGQVLATANFCGFIGIMFSGILYSALDSFMLPSTILACLGLIAFFATALLLLIKNSQQNIGLVVIAACARCLLSIRYKVKVIGLDQIKKDKEQGMVFLPNHPALIDPVLVMTTLYSKFSPRPLSDTGQANKPFIRYLMKIINPITIPDLKSDGRASRGKVKAALGEVVNCLNNCEQVIVYPAGRIYRSELEDLAGNSGVEHIIKSGVKARYILVKTTGLWGSGFSRANNVKPSFAKQLLQAVRFLLANFLFFGPRRKITIEFMEDQRIAKLQERSAINKHLENFYNHNYQANTMVPLYWWQGYKSQTMPEMVQDKNKMHAHKISTATATIVLQKIEDIVGKKVEKEERLANDLSIDSLTLMDLATWLENEFGYPMEDLEALDTVEDCLLAASGQLSDMGNGELEKISPKWFSKKPYPLAMPTGQNITDLFLKQARATPGKIIIADQISGCKSYREIVAGIFILMPHINKIPGKRVGIMLPASVSATMVYFATLFCGKTPVMYNWTVGTGNMAHGIRQTGTECIITAKVLFDRVAEQGSDLSCLDSKWLFLEDIAAKTSIVTKLGALTKTFLRSGSLQKNDIPETAVILFTSGSESMPKAVPLSHRNILANLNDFSSMLTFTDEDSLLGMLPPFHSLGLAGTVVMPLCLGLRTVYHANPTESVTIAKRIASYKTSTLIGTPTFINGILQAAQVEQLQSLKLVFTGAEKCPAKVYEKLAEMNTQAILCEGYGITECSPLVSLNTIESNHPGTIGKVVPSTEYIIVDHETGAEVVQGKKGILLLRGPNIFAGYLGDTSNKGFCEHNNMLWYQTGDFVIESIDHVLTFAGREKRFIKLAGEMISLPAIESVLVGNLNEDSENGPTLAIESTPTEELPEIVLFTTIDMTREEANAQLKDAGLSPLYNIRQVIQIDEIPVLGTGKTDYKELKEILSTKN